MSIAPQDLIVLDTSVFVHIVRNDATGQALLAAYALSSRTERPLFSTVSEGECLAFSTTRNWGTAKKDYLRSLFSELVRISAGLPAIVEAYSELHSINAVRGLNVGQNDLWIAATAQVTGAVILTCDGDFLRLPRDRVRVQFHAP